MKNRQQAAWLLVAAIVGLALNLRPALASIGPLLDMIEAATGLNSAQASLLTTLPVFAMGALALAGGTLRNWLGERNGISLGIAMIALACAARLLASGPWSLLASALFVGLGIALVQALMPAFIKHRFPGDAARVMGLYTTGIMAGAAIAAVSVAGLSETWGWPAALAIWAVPAVAGLLLWLRVSRGGTSRPSASGSADAAIQRPFWRSLRAWELLLFFGIGTGAYTLVLAWLPPFYTGLGWQPAEAGYLLGGLTLTEVCSGLAVSALVSHFPDRRALLLTVLCALLGGLLCLILAPLSLALPGCLLLGCGIGALFPLSLILALDHAESPAQAGALAAFVQGGGYMLASLMPLLAGLLRDHFADLTQAWTIMGGGTVLLILMALRFSPDSCARLRW